jgi:chromosome segregation ATPase
MSAPESHKFVRWTIIFLLAGVVASSVALFRYARLYSGAAAALAHVQSESQGWRTKVDQLAAENNNLRRQLGMPPVHLGDGEKPLQDRRQLERANAARLEATRMLGKLEEGVTAANSKAISLEARNRELESGMEKLNADSQRLLASEADLKERLAGTNRIVEAMQVEMKGRTERLTQLDIENRTLREENRKLSERSAQASGVTRDLDDINRRRDALLNQIQRRYRDLTDQFRILAGRSDREGIGSGGGDLSRLQHAVSLAEEDLRQLDALNSQASRLQQRKRAK